MFRHLVVSFSFALGFLVATSLPIPQSATAGCICVCMNGYNQPLCDSSLDIAPICPPRVCPIEPPSIKPITPPSIPPIGTSVCNDELVWDDYLAQYVWREVCY